MQILCVNPVILQNHQLGYYLSIWKKYKTPNGLTVLDNHVSTHYRYDFPNYQYTPKRFNVTMDNIDDYNVISPDGEMYPMFIAVPCSKCPICRRKKANEWAFRATCENVYSTSQPLFLTMTYNNAHLPQHGVFKEEIQLFMKRMRIKLDRNNIIHNIRYFAVGEYGSKSGRPHYHMLLWNFPTESFGNTYNVLKFVENCWQTPILKNGSMVYKRDGSPKTESLGFCLCKPCDTGAVSYVMKYMRKEARLPEEHSNPVFFLSSRKNGGLGSQYARDYKDFYWKHPECLDITVCDPFSGKSFTSTLPGYFKRLYFPSNSTVCDKITRDTFKLFCENITRRMTLERMAQKLTCLPYTPKIDKFEKQIFKKFWFLNQPFKTRNIPLQNIQDIQHEIYICNLNSLTYARFLELQSFDITYIKQRSKMLQIRERALEFAFGFREPININDVNYTIIQSYKLAQSKEIL